MGIFDFLKRDKKNEDREVNDSSNKLKEEKHIEEKVQYYDEFYKKQEMPRSEWIEHVLLPSIQNNWENADTLYVRIVDSFNKKIYSEIRDACLRLYAIDENNERKTNVLGMFYIKTKEYNQAIDLYKRYIKENGGTESIFTNLAKTYEKIGNMEEAEQNYINALNLNPNSPAFKHFFKIVKKRDKIEYEKRLEQYANLPNTWRAKLKNSIDYFRKGNKEKANYYLLNAIKESDNNSDVMAVSSGIYVVNDLFADLEKNVLPIFNPEKHGAYTTLNILEYYRKTKNYEKGLELCKFSSKFSWLEYKKEFQNFENIFLIMKNNKNKEINNITTDEEIKVSPIKFFATKKPLWYKEFNNPKWLLSTYKKVGKNILLLPFVVVTNNEDNIETMKDIAVSVPLFLNDTFYYSNDLNHNIVIQYRDSDIIVVRENYTKEYMETIKEQNNTLDYVLTGNIIEIREKKYDIINIVEEVPSNKEKDDISYEVELYLYDCNANKKIPLLYDTYKENEIYKLQDKALRKINEAFGFSNEYDFLEKDNSHLFSYAFRLKTILNPENNRENQSWKYKELLSNQISNIIEDKENDLKKIELVEILYDISKNNSQLLKNEKPAIYSMIDNKLFTTDVTKLLLPVVFNVYNDEENYNSYLDNLSNEIEFANNTEYVEWVNKFLNYTN